MESSQRSPGLRPRTPGEPSGGEAWWEIDRRGWRLVVVLLSPPAAALRWSLLAFIIPCLEARLDWRQSRGAAVNSLPLGEGWGIVPPPPGENQKRGPKPPFFVVSRVWGLGRGEIEIPSPQRRFGSFAAVGKGTRVRRRETPRSPQGAKSPRPQTRNPKLRKADAQPSFKISVRSISCASPHRRSRS